MTKGHFRVFTIAVFLLTAGIIGALVFLPERFLAPREKESQQTRVVIPQAMGGGDPGETGETGQGRDTKEDQSLRIDLNEGESALAVLTRDFDGDSFEDQIIAYRRHQEIDSPVFITYADYDSFKGAYVRRWNAATVATKPGTLILYSEDLIGDGGICVLISGMNGAGEQTLTVFRKNEDSGEEPFSKIAEFLIEGSISVEGRSGNSGESLSIATYVRDYESSNMLDQVEITYTYNRINGLYEQARVVKIPGNQIEQRRLGELLSGDSRQFEDFINGLWHQGSGPEDKYIYFNSAAREVIFYDGNLEEIFSWQDSSPTRYGLHIASRNIALTKLRRTISIELASLENIRIRVFQDVYLRTGPNTIWDGSYQKVQTAEPERPERKTNPYLEGTYEGSAGRIHFYRDGTYELSPLAGSSKSNRQGKYVFFSAGEDELLELRSEESSGPESQDRPFSETNRVIFRVNREGENYYFPDTLTLTRIRIGTRGIQDLHEGEVLLTRT
ncbi:MAG: pallilysin-related adhesin [Treponema sp.]|jgi:hypothetical protein|nr:pallilysin-related adhesin [Treponema sp.]